MFTYLSIHLTNIYFYLFMVLATCQSWAKSYWLEMKYGSWIRGAYSLVGKKDDKQINICIETNCAKCYEGKHRTQDTRREFNGGLKLLNSVWKVVDGCALNKGHLNWGHANWVRSWQGRGQEQRMDSSVRKSHLQGFQSGRNLVYVIEKPVGCVSWACVDRSGLK